ncbi:MAG: DNA-protecting protein DprA [Rhodocyclaceae bacterium]|jgi:DNA processing protein|nr:DNA-protecting protein DprA [Rhodocyclaceae bacterium]
MSPSANSATDDLRAWLNLTLPAGIGPRTQQQLLSAFGHPAAVMDAGLSAIAGVIGIKLAQSLFDGLTLEAQQSVLEQTLTWLEAPDHRIITLADKEYPQRLLESADPPSLLYVNGDPAYLNHPAIGIVGSRNATPQGLENARAFSKVLADAGFSIVSGLALGIDAAAHEGALRSDTRSGTIAVIGTGIDRVYPASNKKLAHLITGNGCIISEFPLGTAATASNFPRRNRLIAGLGQACLVVEAAPASGSLITARLAGELGRDIFAIPGSIHAPQYKGCHALIKQGAKLVECAQDILEELGPQVVAATSATTNDETGTAETRPEHAALLRALGHEPATLDQLIARSTLTADVVLAMLTELTLDGVVTNLPGGRYQRLIRA